MTYLASSESEKIDEHYTYTIESDVPTSAGNNGNNEDDNNEEVAGADEVGDGLRRSSDERGSLC